MGNVTFVGSGAATSGTGASVVAAAPAAPNDGVAGDLQVIAVQQRPGGAGASISGWTGDIIEGVSGGAGSEGAGTGTTKTYFFIRELTGAAGSVTVASVGQSVTQVQQHILRKTSTDTWDVVGLGGGADNTTGTTVFSASSPTIPVAGRVTANDMLLALAGAIDDTGVFSAEALTCGGCTTTTTARGTAGGSGTTGGNDARMKMVTAVVNTGSNTTAHAVAFSATNDNTGDAAGSVVFARVRAVTPPPPPTPTAAPTVAKVDNTQVNVTTEVAPAGALYADFYADGVFKGTNSAVLGVAATRAISAPLNTSVSYTYRWSNATVQSVDSPATAFTLTSGSSGPVVTVWNGSAEVAATVEGVWNGSVVVPMASIEVT